MAIPSYGLGPERLFFPNPLTDSNTNIGDFGWK